MLLLSPVFETALLLAHRQARFGLVDSYCTTKLKLVVAVKPVLVAVTVIAKVPAGVPGTGGGGGGATPQPAIASNSTKPSKISMDRSFTRFLRCPPKPTTMMPNTGKASIAYSGLRTAAPGRAGVNSDAVPLLVKIESVMAVGPAVTAGSIDAGLKLHVEADGSPLQLNVITPNVGSGASTLIAIVAMPPGTTLTVPDCGVIIIGGPSEILSVAVLLVGFTSPPPETVAVLVKLF